MASYKQTSGKLVRCVSCGEQGRELVIDFWNCNLDCVFCFAWQYSHSYALIHNRNKKKDASPQEIVRELEIAESPSLGEVCWVRFTGGEPLRIKENIKEILDILSHLNDHVSKELNILIQTNGTTLKKIVNDLDELGDYTSLKILMEISLKGTNPEEFALLTGASNDSFYRAIEGYAVFDEFQKRLANVSLCARLGIFHDVRDSNALTFVYPDWRTRLKNKDEGVVMFHPKNWNEEFRHIQEKEVAKNGCMATEYLKLASGLRPQPHMVRYFVPLIRLNQERLLVDRSEKGFSHKAVAFACDYLNIPTDSSLRIIPSPKSPSDKKLLQKAVNVALEKFPKDATAMFLMKNEFSSR